VGTTADAISAPPTRQRRPWKMASILCMGVVFGDIGTSPLYTLNVAAKASTSNGAVAPEAVLGIVSLIFWSLIVVISISPSRAHQSRRRAAMVIVGLIGATLLYGDGTPGTKRWLPWARYPVWSAGVKRCLLSCIATRSAPGRISGYPARRSWK
jgi:hypothetical protein